MFEDDDISDLLGDPPHAPTAAKITAAQSAVSGAKEKREPQVRVGALNSLEAVAAEAGKLYRKARQTAGNDISPITASRLVMPLKLIADLVQAASLVKFEEIEERLAALEDGRKRK
jgi:hypothetical protein